MDILLAENKVDLICGMKDTVYAGGQKIKLKCHNIDKKNDLNAPFFFLSIDSGRISVQLNHLTNHCQFYFLSHQKHCQFLNIYRQHTHTASMMKTYYLLEIALALNSLFLLFCLKFRLWITRIETMFFFVFLLLIFLYVAHV